MTFFSWARSEQTNVKTLTALPSSPARQLASLMLMPCSLNVWPTVARMPGRFAVITRSCTARLIFAFESQVISTRRSGSVSNAFGQPRRWIGDAATARDEAEDVVARQRVAALGVADEDVVDAVEPDAAVVAP